MPELPEVETVRRGIAPVLEGRVIVRAELRRERMARRNSRPGDVPERLVGRRVDEAGRRGKFLLVTLDRDLHWVMHLGMSGRIAVAEPGAPEAPHTNFVATTDLGAELRFVDPRTFGFVGVFTPDEMAVQLAGVGRDALEDLPGAAELGRLLAGRRAPIKALLLDQRLIAGLGNIYADEALHRARIHPLRPAGSLTREEVGRLRRAIPVVLRAGLRHGGTSLADLAYLLPDGRAGEYLGRLRAYGRAGLPCHRCGTPLRRRVVAQRASHYCPRCQPEDGG